VIGLYIALLADIFTIGDAPTFIVKSVDVPTVIAVAIPEIGSLLRG